VWIPRHGLFNLGGTSGAPVIPAQDLDRGPLLQHAGDHGEVGGRARSAAGRVYNAKLVTEVAQKILVDGDSVEDAVAWGQAEMEKLAAK
jgi:hypothetical protein